MPLHIRYIVGSHHPGLVSTGTIQVETAEDVAQEVKTLTEQIIEADGATILTVQIEKT